ncbi:hypothetical protein Tco_1492439 [Tanacetum coccineum]
MDSRSTRFTIKNDGNDVQKYGGSKQVGFKQLGPCVKRGVHVVHVEKRVWFKVELQGAHEYREAEIIQGSKDYVALARRWLEVNQLEENYKHELLGK